MGGEAGVGKTALAQRFTDELHADVLWGRCDPFVTPPPLGPLLEVAEGAGTGADAFREDAGAHAIATALLDLPRARAPLVLVLEDLHWADEATLDALRVLGRRVGTTQTLVVATYRDDELDRAHPLRIVLGELATTSAVARLVVEPLSPAAVAELAAEVDVDAAKLHRLTSGNPFYVTEVLAAGGRDVPTTVRDAVLARVAHLSASAAAVVEAAAVAPPMLDAALTIAVCGDASDSVDECLATGVLVAVEDGIAFRHELARVAVEETLSPTRRLALHRGVLLALTDRPHGAADLARIAHHAEHAADGEAVLRYAPAAAEQATRLGAHREAAAQYARALSFAERLSPEEQASLHERRSDALYLTDDQVEAIAELEQAIEHHLRAGALDRAAAARGRLVSYLTCRGLLAEAEDSATQSIAVLGELPESALLADATAAMALISAYRGDDTSAIAWGERTLELARRFGGPEKRIEASIELGTVELFRTGESRSLERTLDEARELRLSQLAANAMHNLALGSAARGSHESAARWIEAGLAHCDGLELDLWRLALLSLRVRLELNGGAWTDATSTADVILAEIRDSPEPRLQALLVLALVRARRGDPDTDLSSRRRDLIVSAASDPGWHASLACVRAEVAWLERRLDGVRDETAVVVANSAGDAGVVVGRRARVLAPEERDRRRRTGGGDRAVVAPARGDWRGAADAWRARDRPYETALALSEADDEEALRDPSRSCSDSGPAQWRGWSRAGCASGASAASHAGLDARRRRMRRHLTERQLEVLELSPTACATPRSPIASSSPGARSTTTSRRSCASSTCAPAARRSPPQRGSVCSKTGSAAVPT